MITLAKKQDIKELLRIENENFSLNEGKISSKNFHYHISKQNKLFILKEKNKILGYILLIYYHKSIRIYSIAISKDSQAKGYGKKLLEYVFNLALEVKKIYITLEVKKSNKNAIKLYEKFGFHSKKILQNYYGNEDAIKMIKKVIY